MNTFWTAVATVLPILKHDVFQTVDVSSMGHIKLFKENCRDNIFVYIYLKVVGYCISEIFAKNLRISKVDISSIVDIRLKVDRKVSVMEI